MLQMNLNGPPWSTPALWRVANQAIAESIDRHTRAMGDAVALGQSIRRRIQALDHPMDDLCARTCPYCLDSCCHRAMVWFDFKDLIYLHLGAPAVPAGQLMTCRGQTCRYITDNGCALPRIQRPFVCTWYICAAQKRHLRCVPRSVQQFVFNSLEALKAGRKQLEDMFIRSVTGGTVGLCGHPSNLPKVR